MSADSFEEELIKAMTDPIDPNTPPSAFLPSPIVVRGNASSISAIAASGLTTDKVHLPAASLSRVSPATREKAAKAGEAMPDGSFPIRDGADLKRAVRAFGRAKDKGKAKRHIIRRARALKRADLLPDTWRSLAAKEFPGHASVTADAFDDYDELTAAARTTLTVLASKADRHNAVHPQARQVTPAKLRCVYNRGLVDYAPNECATQEQAAQARVNSFLRLLSAGAPDSPAYVQDNDLLPAGHPARGYVDTVAT